MFFKKKENKTESNFLVKICALLIHAAKIDENYTNSEKEIIKKIIRYKKNNFYLIKIFPNFKIVHFTVK